MTLHYLIIALACVIGAFMLRSTIWIGKAFTSGDMDTLKKLIVIFLLQGICLGALLHV